MEQYRLIAPCHFGTEAVLKEEVKRLGYGILEVTDGKVVFAGDAAAIPRCNVFLRTTERILVEVARFRAVTFDELFERTKAVPWGKWISVDGKFWVAKATSIKSRLFSPSDIQRIMKKAMVESMKQTYRRQIFPETGAPYPVRVTLMKDEVTVGLDTSGESLHKRGYRKLCGKAPISETLAAARENAKCAGVDAGIHFQERDVKALNHPNQYGFVITNPPYGERMEDRAAMPELYQAIRESFQRLPTWSFYLISGYEDAEKYLGAATKRRKIYNGMLKTCFYQYLGPKPPRR